MTEYSTLLFEEPEKGIGLLTLNRPARLNAMSDALVKEFHGFLSRLRESQDTRVLILTGAGRGFCSGVDLKEMDENMTVEELMRHQQGIANLAIALRRIPQPIICAVNGVAAGGGFSIAMASDVRIAATEARFVASFINIGLSAGDMGSSYFLPRLVGVSRAAEILYTGRFVESDEAERIGLLSRVVPADQLIPTSMELARIMLQKTRFGLHMTKEALNHNIDAPSLEAGLEFENRTQILATQTKETRDTVLSFLKGRSAS